MKDKFTIIIAAGAITFLSAGCDVDQTKEARLPEVEVEAEPGNLPEYEVVKTEEGELPSVDVDAKGGQLPEYDVEVADVDVRMEEKTIKVPTIDVDMPDDNDSFANNDDGERSHYPIIAKVETPEPGYDLEIQRVIQLDNGDIAVISTLEVENSMNTAKRVSQDSVHLDRPIDGDITHYVITNVDSTEGVDGDYNFGESLESMGFYEGQGRAIYVSSSY